MFDFSTLTLSSKLETAKQRFPVDQNCTGSAFAQFTTMLGAGESQLFSQHFEQTVMDAECNMMLFTIDLQGPGGSLLRHVPPINGYW